MTPLSLASWHWAFNPFQNTGSHWFRSALPLTYRNGTGVGLPLHTGGLVVLVNLLTHALIRM